MRDLSGNELLRPGRGYSLRIDSKVRMTGITYEISEIRDRLERENSLDQLVYPQDTDALFDVETIKWME